MAASKDVYSDTAVAKGALESQAECTKGLAALRRAGTIEILQRTVGEPPSAAVVAAVRFLEVELSEYDRCDYIMSLCEELGTDVSWSYGTNLKGRADRELYCRIIRKSLTTESLRRVLTSPRGGWRVVEEVIRSTMSFAEMLRKVDPSLFTDVLRRERLEGGVVYRDEAHAVAFSSSRPVVLKWLVDDGLFDASLMTEIMIVSCGNALGLKMLVAGGYDPNSCCNTGEQPLTFRRRSAGMVDALVAVGAQVELLRPPLLLGCVLPSVAAFRRLLQLDPNRVKSLYNWEAFFHYCGDITPLWRLEVMRDFDYPPPSANDVAIADETFQWALFTFSFTNVRPSVDVDRDVALLWRRHTHFACKQKLKDRVVATLLCLKRLHSRFPRDMRHMLLDCAFGREVRWLKPLIQPRRFRRMQLSSPWMMGSEEF